MTTFRKEPPASELSHIIECFWTVESRNTQPEVQKIIPDAFTELIFHFGDPYRIRLRRTWETQPKSLVAGQITKHFFLENTGASSIFAVKLRPSSLTHLFGLGMHALTDQVVDIREAGSKELLSLDAVLRSARREERRATCERFFSKMASRVPADHPVDLAVADVFKEHGMLNISALATSLHISERHLEQLFKKFVGLSPKFFSRIVRFNYIFKLINDNNPDWSDVVFRSGFYDQSHFIRNFKAFTGDDPSKYLFDRKDMANFFLKER